MADIQAAPAPFLPGATVEARLRGKSHWYPATVVRVEVEGNEGHEWRYTISYTDGYRDLHYPPPPPPLMERGVEPRFLRMLDDHAALSEIYDQCGGAGIGKRGWERRTGWDREAVAEMARDARPFYEDIDHWDGAACTNGRLTHILLDTNRLRGHLPGTVWRLDFLVELNVAGNKLEGVIPAAVKNLKSCTWLDLSANAFTGRLPRGIGGCSKLQVLDLSSNQLEGPVPSTLGRCLDLRECHLEDNLFSGDLPFAFVEAIKFCEDLRLFDVSNNASLEGVNDFRDALFKHLPTCAIFVGTPHLEVNDAVQDFGARAERPPTPKALPVLDEEDWEDAFVPPWLKVDDNDTLDDD